MSEKYQSIQPEGQPSPGFGRNFLSGPEKAENLINQGYLAPASAPVRDVSTRNDSATDAPTRGKSGEFVPEAFATTWLPISTAPKDRFILVYCPEDRSRWLVKWQGGEWYGVDCEHGIRRTGQSLNDPDYVTGWFVSCWAEVPAPPTEATP